MTISRRGLVGAGVGSAGSLLLARVAPPVAAAQTQASLQMGWIANVENAGEFVAAEKGYYAAEGVDLELVPGGPGVYRMLGADFPVDAAVHAEAKYEGLSLELDDAQSAPWWHAGWRAAPGASPRAPPGTWPAGRRAGGRG